MPVNPFGDTEEGDAISSAEEPTHFTETTDLRTQIKPPICGHNMAAASTSVTCLPARVTCKACRAILDKTPPPEDP